MPEETDYISQLQNPTDDTEPVSDTATAVADDTASQVDPPASDAQPGSDAGDSPEPSSTAGFRERFKQKYGIDLSSKYQTDEQAEYGLANAFQLVGKRDQDAEIGRLIREQPSVVIDHLRQSYPEAFGQQTPEAKPKQDEVPEWDDEWINQVEEGEGGRIVAKAGVDPAVATKFVKFQRWYQKKQREQVTNFDKLVEERARQIAREEAAQIAQQTFNQGFSQHAQSAKAAGWFERNREWMFVGGDMQQGYSPEGRAYANQIIFAGTPVEQGGLGISDMDAQIRYADSVMPRKQPPNGKQRQHATRQPNVAGSTNGRKDERRENETPIGYAMRMLRQSGLDKE